MTDHLISHIGIAVADLDEAIARFRLLTGRDPDHIAEVADQKVKVAMFAGNAEGASRIELVAPVSQDSPVDGFLNKKGEGLHHLCIYVDDLEATLKRLKAGGVRLIDESPRIGAEGNRIAFVHPTSTNGVLIELEEKPK